MNKYLLFSMIMALLLLPACAKNNSHIGELSSAETGKDVDADNPGQKPSPPPAEQNPIQEPDEPNNDYAEMHPLLWEEKKPETKPWSQFVFNKVDKIALQDLEKTEDVEVFCPNYFKLNRLEKVNFWGQLISAITKYESNFNPLDRYEESSMGKDHVTGRTVVSEGLLQLSYQDISLMPSCEFDWSKDKSLDPKDPNKTILNPFKNLDCGIKILTAQIRKKGSLVLGSSAYWAVLKTTYSKNKIDEIAALTGKLPFCGKKAP